MDGAGAVLTYPLQWGLCGGLSTVASMDSPAASLPASTCRVAFLGPRGTFTEEALYAMVRAGVIPGTRAEVHGAHGAETARGMLSGVRVEGFLRGEQQAVEALAVDSPRAALNAVREGRADYACVAMESAIDGPIAQTEDALVDGDPLVIIGEVMVPVEFSILVRPGTAVGSVATLSTHPAAYAQVSRWLSAHMSGVEFIPASSNAAAAQAVAEGRVDAAAAPARAGEIHHLEPLATAVADVPGAYTRFVLVTTPGSIPARTGHDRTGVVFRLKNRPSSLVDALQELSIRGVDMFRISSRPTRVSLGTYVFHVGIVGHISDDAVAEALAGLYRRTEFLRFVGSWPRAQVPQRHSVSGDGTGDAGFTGSPAACGAGGSTEVAALAVSGASSVSGALITHPSAGTLPPDYSESKTWVEHLQKQVRG